ncbi:MAG TPA: TolC family protein [Armatimonadota bacterium]|nr:TolC family protein [Armatimonadota bacterium]
MRRIFVLLLVCCAFSFTATGQEQTQPITQDQPITLDLCNTVTLAMQRNLAIKAARQDITTASKVVDEVKSRRNLHADLDASYLRLNAPITLDSKIIDINGVPYTIPGDTVADENVFFANVNATYPLYDAGRVRYGVRSAQSLVTEASNLADDTKLAQMLQTALIYLSAIYSKENIRVNEQSLISYQRHLAEATRSRQEGTATDYDVTRAETAVEEQQKRLTITRNQYALALENLRKALQLPKDTPIDLQGTLFDVPEQPPVAQAEEIAVNADPLLRSYVNRSESKSWMAKSVQAEKKPQLDAVGFVNLLNRSEGFLTNAQWFVGLRLSFDFLDGGYTKARAEEITSERVKINTELQNATSETRLSIRSAYLDMDTARSAIASTQKSVTLARESLRLAERRFAEGVGTSLEVFDANVNLLAAETSLQQSLYQLDSAYLTAHRYIGDLQHVACTAQTAQGS